MNQVLRLTVVTGPHRGEKFCLRGEAECLMGRAKECFIQLAGTERDQFISRQHCRLSLDGSSLTIEDLGSLCGTFLDGERVKTATLCLPACEGCHAAASSGDPPSSRFLTIGGTTLRMNVVDCPPADTPELQAAMLWQPDETVKKDCPVPCR